MHNILRENSTKKRQHYKADQHLTSTASFFCLFAGSAGTFGLKHTDRFQSFVLLHGAKAVQPLVDLFKSHGYVEVDMARIHADSEAVLGLLEKSTLAGLKFSTKAHPLIMPFSKENVLKQFYESLTVLGVEHADVFYLINQTNRSRMRRPCRRWTRCTSRASFVSSACPISVLARFRRLSPFARPRSISPQLCTRSW